MKTSMIIALVSLTSLTMAACSNGASLVRKDTLGGQARLEGAYMPAMSEARMVMLEHCHGRFDYQELGEEVAFRCRTVNTTEARRPTVLANGTASR